jgi:hypothetical protein
MRSFVSLHMYEVWYACDVPFWDLIMIRSDIDALRLITPAEYYGDMTMKGLRGLLPDETIAGVAATYDGSRLYQPGMVPMSIGQLLWMTGHDLKNKLVLPHFEIELDKIFSLHEDKSRNRKNERGALVNNLWGALNPENFVVLYLLASALMKDAQRYQRLFKCLFIGTGSGYPEVALCRLAQHMEVKIDVLTIDLGKKTPLIRLDARNKAYGPEKVDGGVGCLIRESSKQIQSWIRMVEDDSNIRKDLFGFAEWDLIVVDGNHMYDAVYLDLLHGWGGLAQGGVMYLDDFGGSKLATNGGVTMAAYCLAALLRIYGYFVSSPSDPFETNSAFFVKEMDASIPTYQMEHYLNEAKKSL